MKLLLVTIIGANVAMATVIVEMAEFQYGKTGSITAGIALMVLYFVLGLWLYGGRDGSSSDNTFG